MGSKTLKLPISIVRAKAGYTVAMEVGCNQQVAHLLLDTGSSSIAIEKHAYAPDRDYYLKPTSFAQAITYGSGGWAGPIIKTQLQLESNRRKMTLKKAEIAIIQTEQQDNFYGADGILGLGYKRLNKAYDLNNYFAERNTDPSDTYPWTFGIEATKSGVKTFKKFIRKYPKYQIKPFFTELEENKITRNKFALYTKRSVMHVEDNDLTQQELEEDPLNQGYLILGCGEEHNELYEGKLQVIDVVHDAYYNTNLLAIQIADNEKIEALPLQEKYANSYFSNSIVDCGSSFIMLQREMFNAMLNQLLELDLNFVEHIDNFQRANAHGEGYFPEQTDLELELDKWPDIHFYLQGKDQSSVKVTCTPDNYWQLNALQPGRAYFMIMNQLNKWPDQSILGLPLISDYFCIFDRQADANGVLKVGKIKI